MADGLRERKKERTRRELRDAALARFVEQGFAATSVRDIAQDAEVSERTFYRYFESKEDVLLVDARAFLADVEAFLVDRPPEESPIRSLLAVRGALEERWTLGEELVWLTHLINENPVVRGRYLSLIYDHHDRIAGIFAERLGGEGDDPRPRMFASAGVSALLDSIALYVESGGVRSNWDYSHEILRSIATGLDPDAG